MSTATGGRVLGDTGVVPSVDGAVPGTGVITAGWAAAAGNSYLDDLATDPVPAGAAFNGGIAFHSSGRMYCTTEAIGVGVTYRAGRAIRADGAAHVATSTDATDTWRAGIRHTATGVMRITL